MEDVLMEDEPQTDCAEQGDLDSSMIEESQIFLLLYKLARIISEKADPSCGIATVFNIVASIVYAFCILVFFLRCQVLVFLPMLIQD